MKYSPWNRDCSCGAPLMMLDQVRASATFACTECDNGLLEIPEFRLVVELPSFKTRRGVMNEQRDVREMAFASRLVQDCLDNSFPSLAMRTDFGIYTPQHFRDIRRAVLAGVGVYELDRVLGSGPAITALIRGVLGEDAMTFVTPYDGIPKQASAEGLIPQEKAAAIPPLYATQHVDDPLARVRIKTTDEQWTWYVVELDKTRTIAYGMVCGHSVEMGYFSVRDLERVGGPWGSRVERDRSFEPMHLSVLQRLHQPTLGIDFER